MKQKFLLLLFVSICSFGSVTQINGFFGKRKKCDERDVAAIKHFVALFYRAQSEKDHSVRESIRTFDAQDARKIIRIGCLKSEEFDQILADMKETDSMREELFCFFTGA